MSKVRVYELAKEYGLKGPDLAKMLRELGFESARTHMTVLDDAAEMQARAIIEAQGLAPAANSAAVADDKPAIPRKKALPGRDGPAAPLKKLPLDDEFEAEESAGADADEDADADAARKKKLPDPVRKPPKKKLPHETHLKTGTGATAVPPAAVPPLDEGGGGAGDRAAAGDGAPAGEAAPPVENPQPGDAAAAGAGGAAGTGTEIPRPQPAERAEQAAAERSAPSTPAREAPERGGEPDGANEVERAAPADAPPAGAERAHAPSPPPRQPEMPPAAERRGSDAPRGQPTREQRPAPAAGQRAGEQRAGEQRTPQQRTPQQRTPQQDTRQQPRPGQRPSEQAPGEPSQRQPAAAADGDAAAQTPPADAAPDERKVKKLLVPEARAKVLGRIELPPEAIRDAKRRSAPATSRADRDLRRAALRSTQTRSAGPGVRRGPGAAGRRGPSPGGPGRRGPASGGRRRGQTSGSLSSTVDPNKVVEIEPPITVKGLSEALGIKVNDLIAAMTFKLGVIGKNINSFLSNDEVELVAIEVNRNIKIVERQEAEEELLQNLTRAGEESHAALRAPVVTFMGHVDHGKTSLLDALRKSDVTRGEAGGITQHIGAYKVVWHDGGQFVVLDTPGHEAFTAMRARGARLTDVVVLVVAADDGVMPQTEEAIAHAKEAGTPIVVAINKCDRPDANPNQVKQQLAVKGLQAEGWGGDVQMVEVSAVTGAGLDDLVEQIMLQAEILELDAKPEAPGEAIVVESKQTPEQGVVVNVLVTNGTLRLRDQVLCGESLGRVRGLIDDHGRQLKEAGPSTPASLVGLTALPSPGDKLYVITDTKKAKEVVEDRQRHARNLSLAERSKATAENLKAQLLQRSIEEIKVILKADVMGSLEPIKQSLARLATEEVRVNVIHSALGGITETDVSLAQASGAMIVGFNTVADQAARIAADRANVPIRYYDVIYNLIDDVKLAMEGKLKPDEVEEVVGHVEIRAIFRSSKFGNIAGCYVQDGVVRRGANTRLSRDGRVIYTGSVASLRREKDDAREVKAGFECGLTLKDFNDIKEGDQLEVYSIKLVKRTLS